MTVNAAPLSVIDANFDQRAWPGDPDIVGAFARDPVTVDEAEQIWADFVSWSQQLGEDVNGSGESVDLYVEAARDDFDMTVPMGRAEIENAILRYMDYIEANYYRLDDAGARSAARPPARHRIGTMTDLRHVETRAWTPEQFIQVVEEFDYALTSIEDDIEAGDLDAATAQAKVDDIYAQMRQVADNVEVEGGAGNSAYDDAQYRFEGMFHWLNQIQGRIDAMAGDKSALPPARRAEGDEYLQRFTAFVDEAIAEINAIADEMPGSDVDTVQAMGVAAKNAIDAAIDALRNVRDDTIDLTSSITMNAARQKSTHLTNRPPARRGWLSSIASMFGVGLSAPEWEKGYSDLYDLIWTNISYAETGKASVDELNSAVADLESIEDSINDLESSIPAGEDMSAEVSVLRSSLERLRSTLDMAIQNANAA